jgi:hypothetical protein
MRRCRLLITFMHGRAIGEFWGWLQRAPKRQLQRSVLATVQ